MWGICVSGGRGRGVRALVGGGFDLSGYNTGRQAYFTNDEPSNPLNAKKKCIQLHAI